MHSYKIYCPSHMCPVAILNNVLTKVDRVSSTEHKHTMIIMLKLYTRFANFNSLVRIYSNLKL